jgi:hypothetical protein
MSIQHFRRIGQRRRAKWCERLPIDKRELAWEDLNAHQQKHYIEWRRFRGFAAASGLD